MRRQKVGSFVRNGTSRYLLIPFFLIEKYDIADRADVRYNSDDPSLLRIEIRRPDDR